MSHEKRTKKEIEAELLPALRILALEGIDAPSQLEVTAVRLCEQDRPDIVRLELTASAAIDSKTELTAFKVDDIDPEDWNPESLVGICASGYPLVVDSGAVTICEQSYGPDGEEASAQIQGWAWHIDDGDAVLWAARLRFASPKPPLVLWWPGGNMRFQCGGKSIDGWRFTTPHGPLFLIKRQGEWMIAFGSAERPARSSVVSALSALGFVFGEEVSVGIINSVGSDAVRHGMVVLQLFQPGRRTSQEAPSLPLSVAVKGHEVTRPDGARDFSSGFVDFVEKILAFEFANPTAPILVAIHQYFESLDGLVEKQFLHAWIAAEAITKWATDNKLLKAVTKGRIADHIGWAKWVNDHRAEIEGYANPRMADQLFGRVMESDAGRQNEVQLVFLGEGIPWTSDMDDAEAARNSTAHRGVMPDAVRNWENWA